MNKIKIICDSTCDISLEKLKELDIDFLPLYVVLHDEYKKDLIDIKWNDVIKWVDENKELPKTAAINVETFIETFSNYVNDGYEVIFLSIGANFSSNFNNARIASLEFDEKVFVIDSMNLSSAQGLLLLKMDKYKKEGLSAKEIVDKINELIPLTITETALETMKYLHKGGRCSSLKYYLGVVLKIYPVVKIIDGIINVHKLGKLLFKKALNIIINDFKNDFDNDNVDMDYIIISTVGNEKGQSYLYEKISEFFPKEKILLYDAGCVVSTHCGPGTTGFFYIKKHN